MSIYRGTTPSILLDFSTFELDVYDVDKIIMHIQHGDKVWEASDQIEFNQSEKQALLHLTQEQTFALSTKHTIYIEADVLMSNGEVMRVAEGEYEVKPTLRKEVVTND